MPNAPALPLAHLLHRMPLFATLSEPQLALLLTGATKHRYRRDDRILTRGVANRHLLVMLSGKAAETTGVTDQGVVLFRYLHPNDHFGESSLIDGLPCSAHVQCLQAADVLAIEGRQFAQALVANPTFAMALLHDLTQRLRRANQRIGDLALGSVSERTVRALAEASAGVDGDHLLVGKVSPTEIARMVGATRETVTRVIRDLQRSGQLVRAGSGGMLLRREGAAA